ncbi:hypothetical protein FJZ18_01385 [Candidatus Pacearchaeota archaeon]|nr:hypothetical protein [Candidatus Pacearchaeota archaeon]
MCFTPSVSLLTAIVEWMLALIMFASFRKSKLAKFFVVLFILLGLYQFSEFMLCTTGNLIWVKIGFISYSFLPAIGLHSVLSYFKIKKNTLLLYAVPSIYSLLAIFQNDFVHFGQCMTFFVQATTILSLNPYLAIPYEMYYAVFIILAFLILAQAYKRAKTKIEKKIDISEMIGIMLMTIPTFILIIIFPSLGIMFPSVLCHFALFLAIMFFASAYLDEKRSLHEKYHRMP